LAATRRPPAESNTPLVERAVQRGLSDRYAAAEEDVARIIDATYRVIERTGTVDPKVRDILVEAGFSSPTFYRHFASKDELLLVILDDGRRRIAGYLEHRMDKAAPGLGRVRSWIEGVAAQATNRDAASRTRPFIANMARLEEQYPEEQSGSKRLLLELLTDAVTDAVRRGEIDSTDVQRDASAVNDLAFAFMERHVLAGTRPSPTDVRHLVGFCERALGAR
jgi:AcrR family transcriptional regulator